MSVPSPILLWASDAPMAAAGTEPLNPAASATAAAATVAVMVEVSCAVTDTAPTDVVDVPSVVPEI